MHARLNRAVVAVLALIVAGLLAILVAKQVHASRDAVDLRVSATTDASDPPAKQAEIDAAQDLEGDLAEPDTPGLLPAFADAGSASEIAAVKTAVPALLTKDRATFRIPLDEGAIAERLGEPLQSTWSEAARTVQYQEKYDALKDILQDPLYRPYSDNRFVVDSWAGVRVNGVDAFALLDGHDEFLDGSGWTSDPVAQWQVTLRWEDATWKLGDTKAISYAAG